MGHTNNSELSTSCAVGLEQKDTKIDLVLEKIRFLLEIENTALFAADCYCSIR